LHHSDEAKAHNFEPPTSNLSTIYFYLFLDKP
jgi:hypothetical protein